MQTGYEIKLATMEDVDGWMALVEVVGEDFPGLVLEDYRQTLIKNIHRQSALCAKLNQCGEIAGVLLFSLNSGCLSCMAVHPEHRKQGIASMMIKEMLRAFQAGSKIEVTTFREGDPKGIAPRDLYQKTGFRPDILTEEFGYPVQKFVLHKSQASTELFKYSSVSELIHFSIHHRFSALSPYRQTPDNNADTQRRR